MTTGGGGLHVKLVRFGYLLISGSPNATTRSLANIECCTLTWLSERGHARYLELERLILQNSSPYRGEGRVY